MATTSWTTLEQRGKTDVIIEVNFILLETALKFLESFKFFLFFTSKIFYFTKFAGSIH